MAHNTPSVDEFSLENDDGIAALQWWESWGKDHGSFRCKTKGPAHPVRFDISVKGNLVATAFVLPKGAQQAQLPPNEPIFEGITDEEKRGQSILDLSLDMPPPVAAPKGKAPKVVAPAAEVAAPKPKKEKAAPKPKKPAK